MVETAAANLDRIALFSPLDAAARAALARDCAWRRYAPHQQVIDRLDDSRDVCFVVEGRVRVVNHSIGGREISFDDVDAGGFLGELSALDGRPRSATVVALVDTLIAFMAPNRFLEVVTNDPRLAMAVMQRMAGIIRNATERIMDLSTLGANNRVHAELLRLAKPSVRPDNTAAITPIPLHGEIASRVSTTRETVARVLSDLARGGIVERRGRKLIITDVGHLKKMVEETRGI